MGKYEALFEDEDNIFGGTPKSKFWDISRQASDEIVADEFDKVLERIAAMEMILAEHYDDEVLESKIKQITFEKSAEIEHHKKGLYIEITGEIVCRLDS